MLPWQYIFFNIDISKYNPNRTLLLRISAGYQKEISIELKTAEKTLAFSWPQKTLPGRTHKPKQLKGETTAEGE